MAIGLGAHCRATALGLDMGTVIMEVLMIGYGPPPVIVSVSMREQTVPVRQRWYAALAGVAVEPLRVPELSIFQNVNTPEDWAAYAAE